MCVDVWVRVGVVGRGEDIGCAGVRLNVFGRGEDVGCVGFAERVPRVCLRCRIVCIIRQMGLLEHPHTSTSDGDWSFSWWIPELRPHPGLLRLPTFPCSGEGSLFAGCIHFDQSWNCRMAAKSLPLCRGRLLICRMSPLRRGTILYVLRVRFASPLRRRLLSSPAYVPRV